MASIYLRARTYYNKHGFRKSVRLLKRKLSGQVAWNIRGPRNDGSYLEDHAKAFVDTRDARSLAEKPNVKGEPASAPVRSGNPKPASRLFPKGNVVIIGDLNLPQCKKYRVVQKVEAIQKMGMAASFSHWLDVPRCVNLLQTATCAIFYRVPGAALIEQYHREARRLGLAIGYDIDDPIFDIDTYKQNANLSTLPKDERVRLLDSCQDYLAAFRFADFLIVSTPGMAEVARKHYSGPVHVWRNAIDIETRQAALHIANLKSGAKIRLGYASGSRAHDADFTVAEPAIAKILEEYPTTELCIMGHHKLGPALSRYSGRLKRTPFQNYSAYIESLAGIDICLIPLVSDGFNSCKSAIRFLEAAMVNVPVIATDVGDFSNLVKHGETGYLTTKRDDWYHCIKELVDSSELREKLGRAAHDFVTTGMMSENVASNLAPELKKILRNA